MDSELNTTPEEATTVAEKQEKELDNLYPKSEGGASSGAKAVEAPPSHGAVCEQEPKLSELLSTLRDKLHIRVQKLNKETTKDGSKAGVGNHGTRLVNAHKILDTEIERFQNFLKKEGHE